MKINESILMNLTIEDAKSIICQVMFDETLRLRKSRSRKERDSIRNFLIESYQVLIADIPNKCDSKEFQDDNQQ